MNEISRHEMIQLLECVKHYMKPELRRKVMTELPQAYNAWMGAEYVAVHRVSDGDKLA